MRRVITIGSGLAALGTAAGLAWGTSTWVLALWLGVVWGLANVWLLVLASTLVLAGPAGRGWHLAGLLGAKFAGLYGLAAWLLVGVRVAPGGWLTGFTVSLLAFGLGFRGVRS